MSKNKKVEMNLEEKLEKALVPVEEQEYKIPDNWVWVGLKYISKKIFAGGDKPENFSKIKTDKNVFPIFSNGIDKNGLYGYTDEPRVLERALTVSARGTIGFTKIREANFIPIIRLIVIILKDRILYEFLDYYFKYNSLVGVGSSIPQLTVPIVNEKIIPLAPLNEQKRIVEKLDFLFDKTKKAKEIIEEIKIDIENRKISILDRAFKGTLTSKWRNENKTSDVRKLLKLINDEKIKKWEEDCIQAEKNGSKKPKKPIIREVEDIIVPVDEQPYKLPDSWVWVRLGDIIRYTDNLDINKYYSDEQVINYVDIDSINNEFNYIEKFKKEKVKDLSSRARRILKKDFILYSSVRPYLNNFAIMKDELEDCIGSTGFFVFKPINISTLYIFRIFLVPYIKELYLTSIKGFNSPSINIEIFNNTPIPLPPLEEQQEIVRILDEVLENENKVKELLELEERIDILEKSILNKAFKGELGTQNNSDESAIELLKEILNK